MSTASRQWQVCMFAILFFTIGLFAPPALIAQLASSVGEICHIVHPSGWVRFKEEINVSTDRVFGQYSQLFGLGNGGEMRIVKATHDKLGYIHTRYQQYHDEVIIQGAVFIIHEKSGRAVKANGRLVRDFERSSRPNLSKQQALERAMQSIDGGQFAWQNANAEGFMQEVLGDSSASHFPDPTLMFTRRDDDQDVVAENLVLAYYVHITTVQPSASYDVYIDAIDGSLVKKIRNTTGCFDAQANTLYNGEQTIHVATLGSDYVLEDDCQGTLIHTRSIEGLLSSNPTQHNVTHGDLDWTDGANLDPYTQTHWAGMMTYAYFKGAFNYSGYDDAGATMLHLVGGDDATNWYSQYECVQITNPTDLTEYFTNWPNSLDIIGHEWAHALTVSASGLMTSSEQGALYESFGDILGSMVECYGEGLYDPNNQYPCEDFIIGEEALTALYQRDMINPHAHSQPDTYYGRYWADATGNHSRGGVQNRWFTLLALGSDGQKINNHWCSPYTYNVAKIGKEKAALVAFRNLVDYIIPSSNYVDAMLGSLEAANDLFNSQHLTENDVQQIAEAWKAVGVYPNKVGYDYKRCMTYTSQSTETRLEAINTIRAGMVCGIESANVLEAGTDLVYVAGNQVHLVNEFHAKSGSSFHAYIADPCATFFPKSVGNLTNRDGRKNSKNEGLPPLSAMADPTILVVPNPLSLYGEVRFAVTEMARLNIVALLQS